MLPCPIKHFTGIDCLGCGIQRSFNFLIDMKFKESFEIYPPLIIGIIFTVLFFVAKINIKKDINVNLLVKSLIVIVVLNYIVKITL